MSVRALFVPADPQNPMRRITLRGDEGHQVTQIQQRVGGWLDMARVAVVTDYWNDGSRDEKWVYAAVHDTGMLDGLPINERLARILEVVLHGDAVLTASHSSDGSSCDLPAMIENYLGEDIEDEESEESDDSRP